MEQITSALNINNLLSQIENTSDSTRFKELLEQLAVFCINLDVNQRDINEQNIENSISAMTMLEKITIYLFSEYSSLLRDYEHDLTSKAMQLCALASEKLGDYLSHVNREELQKLEYNKILYKQLKTYWRASIAYTLSGNPPNSFVVAKKYEQVLNKLESDEILQPEMRNIYKLSFFILSRYFVNNIEKYIDDGSLIEVYNLLKEFLINGNNESAVTSMSKLDTIIQEKLHNYSTGAFWCLKYLRTCLESIIKNSVWSNLSDLFSRNYIQQLIKSKPAIIELWQNQLSAVNNPDGFLRKDHIKRTMINFPTSGGKSLLAEFAIIKELEKDNAKKCFYIVPTNALVYEVTKRLRERFRRLDYKVSSSVSGYEPDFVYGNHTEDNVVVTTPEKLDTIIRNSLSDDLLNHVSLIIFDEFHKIQDKQRGWIIEGSISFLISHEIYSKIKLVLLSAIIDNGAAVLNWIDDTQHASSYVPNDWKPTIKLKGIANWDYIRENQRWVALSSEDPQFKEGYKNFKASARIKYRINGTERQIPLFQFARYHDRGNNSVVDGINMKRENFIMGIAQKLKNVGGSLIYFHSKEECEKFVRNYEPLYPERLEITREIQHLIDYIEKRLGSNHLLTIGLSKGLVYHHGSLPIDIREALEDYYLKGYIKIMVCTTTLVEGVNFPIQNFIHSGRRYPLERTLSAGDFKNIAGRAGRAYQNTYGQIIYVNFFNNIVNEHLNYEQYENIVTSALKDDNELFAKLDALEQVDEEQEESALLDLTSNPFAKTLLLFYNSLSTNPEDVQLILNNTFFAKQADLEMLKTIKKFSGRMYYFYDSRPPIELIKIQESGLSFNSYRIVKQLAGTVLEKYHSLSGISTSLTQLISPELYKQLLLLSESKRFDVRKTTTTSRVVQIDDYNLFIDWIQSEKTLNDLSEEYFRSVDEDYRMTRMVEYARDMFEYKLPWVIGTLCSIVIEEVGDVEYFMYLPLFIKYGVNHTVDVNLFKLGLNSRETVKDLSTYIRGNTSLNAVDELRDYLKEADPLMFLEEGEGLTDFEVRKLVTLSNNYKELTNFFYKNQFVDIRLAGTKFYLCQSPDRDGILSELMKGSHLILKRERNNFYDENAVEVYMGQHKLGYIPRDINEEIAYYLDLNNNYTLIVEHVNVVDRNRFIEVMMRLSFDV